MDPMQLQLMQQMGLGQVPGIPGMQAPLSAGGAGQLAMMSQPGMSPYAPAIAGNAFPDVSPLAPLQPQLQQFGMIGMLGGIAGNAYLTSMMKENGVLPMGNAGSYMQAYRAREFQQMQQAVGQQVAGQDSESFYRTFRGMAAMTGMPFNREQRSAARGLANTMAEYGPMLAMAAPGLLDAFAGERGSVQAMSAQMMEANRYRMDPLTGRMGYGTEANADLVNNVFETMFDEDNMARMQGMRAGDMGQLYRRLAGEGLAGPRGSTQDRTLLALNAARGAGELEAIGEEAGVNVDGNLAALSSEDLTKLRQTNSMRQRMSDSDARQVSDQLQDYVGTLSAMREVFGENGNPNAPIPQLINALESLTSGQMHKFDASRLNTMVRDMQSLSQMSGKSVDQILAMNQTAAAQGHQFGLGTTFAPTATNVGLLTGMAFQQEGGATGFGALNREGAEQAAMSYFNRGMASEMANTLGALGRIEEAGGFADNDAGRRLSAVMEAARAGESTYIDPNTGTERALPTKEAEFRSFITADAVPGMNRASFNMMLADRTSNLRMLNEDPELQQAAFNNQARDINKNIARQIGNRLSSEDALMDSGLDARGRNAAARAMGTAATQALGDLSPQDVQNAGVRNRAIADALMVEAGNQGVEMTDKEALTMAAGAFGQAENGARRFGFESYTAFSQVMGDNVSGVRAERAAQARARAGVNEALSGMGPRGGIMERFFSAVQKQGDRGSEANLETLIQDMFGADMDQAKERLMPELQAVADQKEEIDRMTAEIDGATPARRRELQREIKQKTKDLNARVVELRDIGMDMGIGGGEEVFNREDLYRAEDASRDLENINRSDQVRLLAASGSVSDAERIAIADADLTRADYEALAVSDRQKQLEEADTLSAGDIEKLPDEVKSLYETLKGRGVTEKAARARVKEVMRSRVGGTEDIAIGLANTYGDEMKAGGLSKAEQDMLVRNRRAGMQIAPSDADIEDRMDSMREVMQLPANEDMTSKERISFMRMAEDQLLAENQLRALGQLGEDQTLNADAADLGQYGDLNVDLKQKLVAAKPEERAEIVKKYLDQQQLEQFYGKDPAEIEKNRVAAVEQLGTAAGQRSISDTEANLATMMDARREFLLDEDAATRLGAARSVRAVKRSRAAEEGLQDLANRYFNGSVGSMVSSGGLAMDAEGAAKAEADFGRLTDVQKETVAARLSQAGPEVKAGDLTAQNYKAYLGLQARDYTDELTAANEELSGAADQSLMAEELGVTQEELGALQKLATLEISDVEGAAKKLGMTEDEYREAMRGGEIDKSLRLFSGEDADKQLVAAKSDERRLNALQVRRQKIQAERQTDAGKDSASLAREEERLTALMEPMQERQNKRMEDAGLDPSKAEDVETYKKRLSNQGSLQQLEKKREEYLTQRQVLKDQGMSEAEIDTQLGSMKEREEEAQAQLKAFRDADLGATDLALADAFGLDTTEVTDELTAFKSGITDAGPGAKRTQAMVARALDKVGKLDIGDADSTAVEKLDMLTDQYRDASADERKVLAQKHGMDVKDLDRMMSQTEFLGMREDKGDYTQDDFKDALKRVGGRDVEAEVAKEEERQMKLTGTVNITGVVNGEGTFQDALGVTVR